MKNPVSQKDPTKQTQRELQAIQSSFLCIRTLLFLSQHPLPESAFQDRLKQGALPLTLATLRLALARLVRNNLLKTKSAPHSERTYALTPKGRRLLNSATDHLELLSKSLKP